MISAIAKAIASALFGWIGGLIASWRQRREDQSAGVSAQAARETASASATEARMAQSEANTDRSQDAIADAAEQGKF